MRSICVPLKTPKSRNPGLESEGVSMLARHYGFTEEELDFIINYDIKYRMGNAPESEARREGSSEAKNGEAAHKGPHELNAEE